MHGIAGNRNLLWYMHYIKIEEIDGGRDYIA